MSSVWPLALVGAGFIAVGIGGLYRNRGSARWPAVAGTVVDVEIEKRSPELGSSAGAFRYFTILHYTYLVGGRLYRGKRDLGGAGVTSRANAVDMGRRYKPGQRIDVFADEHGPQRHTLFPAEHRWFWVTIVWGLCWLGFALKVALE